MKDNQIFGPKRFKDESFDTELLTLEYEGQRIDLGSSDESRVYNHAKKRWEECKTDYSKYVSHEIYGLTVPVITLRELIKYKKVIGRPTDIEDALAISNK